MGFGATRFCHHAGAWPSAVPESAPRESSRLSTLGQGVLTALPRQRGPAQWLPSLSSPAGSRGGTSQARLPPGVAVCPRPVPMSPAILGRPTSNRTASDRIPMLLFIVAPHFASIAERPVFYYYIDHGIPLLFLELLQNPWTPRVRPRSSSRRRSCRANSPRGQGGPPEQVHVAPPVGADGVRCCIGPRAPSRMVRRQRGTGSPCGAGIAGRQDHAIIRLRASPRSSGGRACPW